MSFIENARIYVQFPSAAVIAKSAYAIHDSRFIDFPYVKLYPMYF